MGLMTSLFFIGCKGKDNGDAITNDTMMDAIAAGSETNNMMDDLPSETTPVPADEVYSISTFIVDLRSDEVYGQGQTHSHLE